MSPYKPYAAYKDSGVEWLGRVPEHWSILRLGQFGLFSKGSGSTKQDEQPTGVPCIRYGDLYTTHTHFIKGSRSCVAMERAKDYTPLRYGDILFAASGETVEEIGKSAANLLTADARCGGDIIIFRSTTKVDPRFMGYALDSHPSLFQKSGMGRGYTVVHIYPSQLRNLLVAMPTQPEQRRVATFLDRETARIDALIEKKQRLIELLKEKRQAVITQAVTKGLDPNVPMKDSGVEWLGEVPEHWVVMSLSRVTATRCDGPFGSGIKSEHYSEQGARVIRLQNIRPAYFDDTDRAYLDLAYFHSELTHHSVIAGDLLIADLGDERNPVGRACVAPDGIEPALVKADCFRFRLKAFVADVRFVALQLSAGADADGGVLSTGSTRSRIALSTTATRKLALPPNEEQVKIVNFIATNIARLEALSLKVARSIFLLQEQRSALITAAVTGQIDVRDAA